MSAQTMALRPYQEAAREAVLREWGEGVQKTLLVMATGTGKTIVFSSIAEDVVRHGGRVLVLAHRGELLDQAQDKIRRATGIETAREQASESADTAPQRITVGSIQTLTQDRRLEAYDRDHFDAIVVDEAHHALSDSYQKVLQYFGGSRVLGVTATPDRGDRQSLGQYFDSIAYEYSMRDGVRDGYLSPIRAQTMPLNIDISQVKVTAGDYQLRAIGHALDPYLDEIAKIIAEEVPDRKTLIFLPLINTSQKMTLALQKHGIKAAEVNGESTNREEILRDFEAGRYQVLCNSMLLTEGYDCPAIDCIVPLRPTKIRSLYAQMVGRGTRIAPGKENLLLLDFLWHTGTHDLVRPAYLVAPNKEIADHMTDALAEGQPLDLEEAMEQAKLDAVEAREAKLAEELARLRRQKKRLVDPLQYSISIAAEDLIDYQPSFAWERDPATEKQTFALENLGIDPSGIRSKGQANAILSRLIDRREQGLATPKQIRQLERRGFQHVGTWTLSQASVVIGQIAQNNWVTPYWIDPATYDPREATA